MDVSRRAYLGAVGSAPVLGAGCVGEFGRTIGRDEPDQVSIEILTAPEDEDLFSLRIANHLAANMEAAGIDVEVLPTRRQTLWRDVLINRDFAMYVGRHPGQTDPEVLYTLFHSRYAEEPGWQNPTSYTNTVADGLLEMQRRDPSDRLETLADVQQLIAEEVPIIPIAFEQFFTTIASERISSGSGVSPDHALWPIGLQPVASDDLDEADRETVLRLGATDSRITRNLNPLSVDFRGVDGLTELIYEPLMRWDGARHIPWLLESWEWTSPVDASVPTIELRLRDGLQWHDGEMLTADDVAFTYQFYQDMTMESNDPSLPAPRFRGESSMVDSIEAIDDSTVRIQFVPTSRRIAFWPLTIPILPEHIWFDRTGMTRIGGIELSAQTTDAVVVDNLLPIGSGPYRCVDVETDQHVVFERFDPHFLNPDAPDEIPEHFPGFPAFDRFEIELRPSPLNVLESIKAGELDGSLTSLGRRLMQDGLDESSETLTGVMRETTWLFHIGFNLRRLPFTLVGFRRSLAGLLDREYLFTEVFSDGANPTVSPVADVDFVPVGLTWPNPGPIEFAGESGSGTVTPDAARSLFRDAGFQYTPDGELLIQN